MGTLSVDKLVKTSTGAAEFTLPATDGTAGQSNADRWFWTV